MKLLHAADFHLDSPFSGLSAEKAALRRRELRELPGRLARLVREEGVELVLLPGDLFDGGRVRPESVRALKDALAAMAVPVFIAPGNHDPYEDASPYAGEGWPDNVHIFRSAALETVELPALDCAVHGCAFTAPHREDDPLAGFSAPKDGRTHLLCLHGEVAEAGAYAPIRPQSLAGSGARYAALGHVHSAAAQWAGDTFWAYPGCPEGRGFDECGEKGVLLVGVGEEEPDLRFRAVCRRRYESFGVDAGCFGQWLEEREPSPDLARILLTGASERAPDLAALTRRAQEKFFYAELADATFLPRDLWDRAGEDSLTGLFLREMKRRIDEAEREDRPRLYMAARFGLAALEGEEDPLP